MIVTIPSAVRSFLQLIKPTDPPRPATDWLAEIYRNLAAPGQGDDAGEWAERKEKPFLTALGREHGALSHMGKFAPFEFNSSSRYILQGCAFVEPLDAPDVKEAKNRRSRFSAYAGLLRGLSPLEFEALCAGILQLLGVAEPRLTPRSGDDGLDFYGRLHLEAHVFAEDVYPTVQKQLRVWMIGQAKHYVTTKIATPAIRELVGSVDLAKARAYSGGDAQYADLEIRACDPVFYLFFTTARMSANVWSLVARSEVVGMDGEMLAAFLADREVGVTGGNLDDSKFREWLSRYAS